MARCRGIVSHIQFKTYLAFSQLFAWAYLANILVSRNRSYMFVCLFVCFIKKVISLSKVKDKPKHDYR